jgi:hypothetical protein
MIIVVENVKTNDLKQENRSLINVAHLAAMTRLQLHILYFTKSNLVSRMGLKWLMILPQIRKAPVVFA